ncbi:unnamed protein product, partial [Prorocentrum cordatum]
ASLSIRSALPRRQVRGLRRALRTQGHPRVCVCVSTLPVPSLGQAAGASQRRDANGTHDSGATVWTGRAPYSGKVTHRCRMLLSRLDAHRIPRQLHASEDEQEEQRRSGRRTRKMMTRTRNYTTTKPCDPADAAQAARVPGIATKQLRATHNLQPAIPMRWGRIPHAG